MRCSVRLVPEVLALTSVHAFGVSSLRWIGRERRGAWLKISHPDIERTEAWFDQWGGAAVLLGRMVPGIRTLDQRSCRFCWDARGTFLC
jgi:hypothetical protein